MTASLDVTLEEIRQGAENVIAILPGSDPVLKSEAVVIGAHYDHLGFGHYGTRSSSAEGQIHHGADDNASGTAVLLRVAELMARSERKPARTVIFAAFSGEEWGLHGSRHYVSHPPFSLSSTRTMVNLDMVGRLRDDRLTLFGARSAKELSAVFLEEARLLALQIIESDGIGRSDHMSFYNKKVPSVHLFTGTHTDYHRPSTSLSALYSLLSSLNALLDGDEFMPMPLGGLVVVAPEIGPERYLGDSGIPGADHDPAGLCFLHVRLH